MDEHAVNFEPAIDAVGQAATGSSDPPANEVPPTVQMQDSGLVESGVFPAPESPEADWFPTKALEDRPLDERAGDAPPRVEGYEILSTLGVGGMGVVYKARQCKLNRLVALKIIRSGKHAPVEALIRFRIEAEAVANLEHPNIVQIYDGGEAYRVPFLALEYT